MCNLLNYFKTFRKTTGSSSNYFLDKPNSGNSEQPGGQANNVYERTRVFYSIKNSESFECKNNLVGKLIANNDAELNNIKVVAPLKNLNSFIFNLDFSVINTEIKLILKWSQYCVLNEKVKREKKAETPAEVDNAAIPEVCAIDRSLTSKFNFADCSYSTRKI